MDRRISTLILGLMSVLILPSIPNNWIAVVFLVLGLILVKTHITFACYIIGLSICILSINIHFNGLKYIFPANSSIKGTIVSLPKQGNTHNSFKFELSSVIHQQQSLDIKGKILVSWAGEHSLKQGQQWLFELKSKPITGLFNDGSFNYQRYLLSQGIIARGVVKSAIPINLTPDKRGILASTLSNYINELSHHRFINALILGDKRNFDNDDWQVMRETGTSHLFAISGLHLSLIALFVGAIVRFIFKLINIAVSIKTPISDAVVLIMIVASCIFYSFLAGYSDPTLRALAMVVIFSVGLVINQRFTFYQLLLFTLLIFGLLNPLSFLAQGFWLSLCAVGVVYFVLTTSTTSSNLHELSQFVRLKNKIIFLIKLQCGLAIGLCVIQVWFFGGLSLTAPLANLIAVPVVTLLILPLVFIGCCLIVCNWQSAGYLCFYSANQLLDWLFSFLRWLASTPWDWLSGQWVFYSLIFVVTAIGFITFFVFMPYIDRLVKIRWLLIFMIFWGVALYGGQRLMHDDNNWRIDFLDVGHGNSAIIRYQNRAIIIDTGNTFGDDSSLAQTVVLPFLQYHHLNSIDYIITTHQDSDHAGGLDYLKRQFPQAKLINNHDGSCLSKNGRSENNFKWQGLTIKTTQVLGTFKKSQHTENNLSCLIRISNSAGSVLFSGDIERAAERQLVTQLESKSEHQKSDWVSTVLQVPHHGSNTSSSKTFIQLIDPEIGIVSTRAYNQWYFPRSNVLNRYRQQQTQIINTAKSGQITIEFSANGPIISTFRDHHWPFWYNGDLSFGHYGR